jgi:hypothetical protein
MPYPKLTIADNNGYTVAAHQDTATQNHET